MSRRLFREGGPHRIKRLRGDSYSMSVRIPEDRDGRVARECPDKACSPGYFKVRLGTGITDGQQVAYCPYCRHGAEPSEFATKEQARFARDTLLREAKKGVQSMIGEALGLGSSGTRKMGSGLISIELSYKPGSIPPVHRPFEDEVRRDVVCPHCTLDQTVFGLATWCSDCGNDIFMVHVAEELAVVRLMVDDIGRREELLGRRVGAKDLENCLEDSVSIFEAALKALVRRSLVERGIAKEEIEARFKKIGNAFQSIIRTREQLVDLFGFRIDEDALWNSMSLSFEKRHPVAHNLGVMDRKYLERAQQAEREGREVRITPGEIDALLTNAERAIASIRTGILPVRTEIATHSD